jgi:HicB-like antitoxin of HicAB toxin-antitoxin system
MSYNGWSNYQTWNVNLWIDNDPGRFDYWYSTAKSIFESAVAEPPISRAERARFVLADRLKQITTDRAPVLVASCYSDLLTSALGLVNWDEIAEKMIDTIAAPFFETIAGREVCFEYAEEGGYTVHVPAMPGCISEGDTLKEARAMIEDAIKLMATE